VFYNIQSIIGRVVCVSQMITAVMSLNIDTMTSHVRTCVQCVGNGLHWRAIWQDIVSYIVRLTYMHSVWQMLFNLCGLSNDYVADDFGW